MRDDQPPADTEPTGEVRPVDLRDWVDFSPEHATRVRVLATDRLALDLWCIEPQQATDVLQYPTSDVTYTVIGGRSWFVTEQGEIGLDPLGSMLVPAGTMHGIDNRGTDPLIVSAACSPPDDLAVGRPVTDEGRAIRDDSQYGKVRERLKGAVGRLFGS